MALVLIWLYEIEINIVVMHNFKNKGKMRGNIC